MKKVIIAALVLLLLVLAGRFAYDRYLEQRAPLSAEEIKLGQDTCVERFEEAQTFVTKEAKGKRVTEPRLFFSPSKRSCILTYLMIDPLKPDAETYNTFLVYNFDSNAALYASGENQIRTYEDYLSKIAELEK